VLRGLLAVAAAALAAAAPAWGPKTLVLTGSGAGVFDLEAADLTGDGRPEVVVTRLRFKSYDTEPIAVFSQVGGAWRDVTGDLFRGEPPRTQHARQILLADLNGDGRNDIFIADHGYDDEPFPGYHPSLALSTADGKLVDATGSLPDVSGFNHSACTGDVDRDGDLDVYVNALGGRGSTLLVNDGRASFTQDRTRIPAAESGGNGANWYVRCLLADVTGDGAVDLVLGAEAGTRRSKVLVNDGTGRFPTAIELPPKQFGDDAIAIALATIDLNHDGRLDLVVGHTRGDPFYVGGLVQVLVNDGGGRFADETARRMPQPDNSGPWPFALRVADVDGDGDSDVGVAWLVALPNEPLLYENRDGIFAPAAAIPAPSLFTFLDANGDGRPDVYAVDGGERHYVLLQDGPAPPPVPAPPATTAPTTTAPAPPAAPPRATAPPPPAAPAAPGAPRGLRARALRDRVRLTWQPSARAAVYELLRNGRRIAVVAATRYDDRKARRGATYVYRVVAANDTGTSAPSAPVRVSRR
jgi:hypothetical protein